MNKAAIGSLYLAGGLATEAALQWNGEYIRNSNLIQMGIRIGLWPLTWALVAHTAKQASE